MTKRSEPFSVIDKLTEGNSKLLLLMKRISVKNKRFKDFMGTVKNCSARGLINASRFHSNKTVFNNVIKTDTVLTANLVQFFYYFGCFFRLAVQLNRNALFKINFDIFRLVGCLSRENAKLKESVFLILRLV